MLFQGSLRSTTVRLMLIWFTLCFGTYGLNTWISTIFRDIGIGNEFVPTFLFALANLPGNLASFVLIERLGRKRLLAYSMLLAALSAFFFALTSRKAPWVAVAASCAFQAFSVSGWNALDALSTESFPTVSRTTGMGILSGTGRFASLVAMVVNGTLERSIVLLFTVTGALTITGAVSSFLLPYEPTGMSLDGMTRGAPLYRELPPMV
jgi:MFS family permease